MKIAVLGASGQIARDYISHIRGIPNREVTAFVRSESLSKTSALLGLDVRVRTYTDPEIEDEYDLVINCVGVGNPINANLTDKSLVQIAKHFDDLALEMTARSPVAKYIFLSSGVSYGNNFYSPVKSTTVPKNIFDPNNPLENYARAKFEIEAGHRNIPDLHIYDARIFGYFNRSMDITSEFLMTKIAHAIVNEHLFTTSSENIVRDYSNAHDFVLMVEAIMCSPGRNMALDFYTKAPVKKFEMLEVLSEEFGLEYKIDPALHVTSPTGLKPNYFSQNYVAESLGFLPPNSALENILCELKNLIRRL